MKLSKQQWISGVLLFFVIVAVAVIQYGLVNRPVPVDVNEQKITPATAKLNQEELLIEDAIDDSNGTLFLMEGEINELIDIHFDKARLSAQTLETFADEPTPPPKGLESIDFFWVDVKDELRRESVEPGQTDRKAIAALLAKPVGSEGCKTDIKVEVADGSKFPTYQRYYQTSGNDQTRDFYMSVDSDLSVSITVAPLNVEEGSDPFAPGCGKKLQVGPTFNKINDGHWKEFNVIAPANSIIHFRISQDGADAAKQHADLFEPFKFGSNPLRAKSVVVQPVSATPAPAHHQIKANHPCGVFPFYGWQIWNKRTPANLAITTLEQPLTITKFSLNGEMLQLDFSGTALVARKGECISKSFLETVPKYPVYNGAMLLAVGGLLGWFIKNIKDIFKEKPEDDYKPDVD